MAVKTTTTVVLHDAHVCARVAHIAAFVAAYQTVCCFLAAVACACVARRAVRADRVATKAANRAATKAANAARVARKEAAEQYASRCAKRAAAKKAAAPAARAAKKAAAAAAKAIKALNECRIMAVRASSMAKKATAKTIAAATEAVATEAVATAVTAPATKAVTTADVRANKAAIVAFLAQTPCLCALWFYATLDVATKAAAKEANKAANAARSRIKAPRVRVNDDAKRASITLACANARASKAARAAADAHAMASMGSVMSQRTIEARAAQGDAQRAANAARKAAAPAKVARPQVVIVRSGPVKNKGAKRTKVHHMVHTVESVMAQVAKKAAIVKAKEDAQIAKAKKWAMRKAAYANRKAAMEVIAADAWMLKGVWLSEDLIRGANDWSYAVRINAFKEARNIAYGTVALVGVAA